MTRPDPLLLFFVVVYAAGGAPSAPLPATAAVALSLALLASAKLLSRWGALALGVVFLLAAVRAQVTANLAHERYERARAATAPPATCQIEGRVASSPTVRSGADRVVIEVDRGTCAARHRSAQDLASGDRLVVMGNAPGLGRGDLLSVRAEVAPVQLFANEELSSRLATVSRSGVASSGKLVALSVERRGSGLLRAIDGARTQVRERIEATYHPEAAPLGRALVLGESDLDPDVDQAFRETGLSHLLAVSGTHLIVAILSIASFLRAMLVRVVWLSGRFDVSRISSGVAIPLAWAYSELTGGSGSVVRAAAMLTAALGARVLGRASSTPRALAAALLVGVVSDPLAILDVSFTLSMAATAGLLLLARPLGRLLGAEAKEGAGVLRRAWASVAEAMATTLGATLACAPVVATMSPTLPVVGLFANLVAAPLGEMFALPVCLAHAALGLVPPLELGAARVGSGALLGVLAVARAAAGIGLTLAIPTPTSIQLAALGVGATAIASASSRAARVARGVLVALSLMVLELAATRAAQPRGILRVSVLDVGQGDSILIDLPEGGAMLIDGGGIPGSPLDVGQRVILPVLRARRRERVDVVVLSHPHPDHYGGLVSTIPAIEIGELWDTGESERDGPARGGLAAVLGAARAQGARVMRPADLCGAPRIMEGVTIRVLSPCPGLTEGESANDGSFVLRLTFGRRSVLLVGDAELAAEERLVAAGDALDADLLKVGHHGSKTSSSPAFVAAVAPRHAIISCGVRNRFGHPTRQALSALEDEGALIRRTDQGGQFRWWTDGDEVGTSR